MSDRFGALLRKARENAGLSVTELGRQAGLDPSHIYRLEIGERRPSQESTLVLAEILRLDLTSINHWLTAAGFAPLPEVEETSNFRVRGSTQRRRFNQPGAVPPANLVDWARWLQEIGLDGASLKQLQRAIEQTPPQQRAQSIAAVRAVLARVVRSGELPVHTAVIPATAPSYQMLAAPLLQQMFLQAVHEAADAGITAILALLPAGASASLIEPLREIFDLAALQITSIEARSGMSLGEALLLAEEPIGGANFAVLTPAVGSYPAQNAAPLLPHLLDVFIKRHTVATVAVHVLSRRATAPEQNVCLSGISLSARLIQIGVNKGASGETPAAAVRRYHETGRYVLQSVVFEALRSVPAQNRRPPLLRDALEQLGAHGHTVMGVVVPSTPVKDAFLQAIAQDYY